MSGQGDATIHDVTTSWETVEPAFTAVQSSFKWQDLQLKRQAIETTLNRYRTTVASLETYLKSLTADKVDGGALLATVDSYNDVAEKYEKMIREKVAEQAQVTAELVQMRVEAGVDVGGINAQRRPSPGGPKLSTALSIFAPAEAEIELTTTYGMTLFAMLLYTRQLIAVHTVVSSARWTPLYDVRVRTETKEAPVDITYKAAIHQNTGEVSIFKSFICVLSPIVFHFCHSITGLEQCSHYAADCNSSVWPRSAQA